MLAIGLFAGLGLCWPPPARPQVPAGRVETLDLPLPAIPWLVLPARWQNQPAIMLFTRGEAVVPGAPGGPRLSLFTVRAAGWVRLGEWPLPVGARWIEPLRLAGEETAWLMLQGPQLLLGRVTAAGLNWQPLCTCPSLYAQADPEELGTRLALDLDGDGADEVLLPLSRGLAIYRTVRLGAAATAPIGLEPVVLELWEPGGSAVAPGSVPELTPWNARDGTRLLQLQRDVLVSYRLPPGAKPPPVLLGAEARARAQAAGLPDPIREALARVPDGNYADGAALASAMTRDGGEAALAPHLAALLTALGGGWREARADRSALPGLDQRPEDRGYLLALEDLNGDAIPDLVHGLVRNESQILKAESELRFYPGANTGSFSFGAPQTIAAKGPAVAAVLHIGPKERMLLVARTEASLGALFRALSSRQLNVEASAYALGAGGLGMQPVRRTDLTFKGFEEGSQVLALTADLTGTGRAAVLMNLQPDAIGVYFPDSAGPDFGKPAALLQGPLPRKREETFVGDRQGEGREAVLFWYRGRKASDALRRTLRLIRWVPG